MMLPTHKGDTFAYVRFRAPRGIQGCFEDGSQAWNKNRMNDIARLRAFITATAEIVETQSNEDAILTRLAPKMEAMIRDDDWLPEAYAVTGGSRYRQYLLYADPLDRFSVVSFVWGPNQATPIHDHRVWGLIGVLRGEKVSIGYTRRADGSLQPKAPERFVAGDVVAVSPQI